jgi:hypothetical protein
VHFLPGTEDQPPIGVKRAVSEPDFHGTRQIL